jgi:hypothetical protein
MKTGSGTKILAVTVSIVVGLAIGVAIYILDSPGVQRQRKMDTRRIKDLCDISHSIDTYWDRKKSLPFDLADLDREPGLKIALKDPETSISYVYEVTSNRSYRLCAVFSMDSSGESQEYYMSRKWAHGAGKQCFDLKPPKEDGR